MPATMTLTTHHQDSTLEDQIIEPHPGAAFPEMSDDGAHAEPGKPSNAALEPRRVACKIEGTSARGAKPKSKKELRAVCAQHVGRANIDPVGLSRRFVARSPALCRPLCPTPLALQ